MSARGGFRQKLGLCWKGNFRRKFVVTATAALACALALVCFGFNAGFRFVSNARTDSIIEVIHDNGGFFPRVFDRETSSAIMPETPFATRFFTATIDASGAVVGVRVDNVAAIDEQEASVLAQEAFGRSERKGFIGSYRYAVFVEEEGTSMVIVVDCSAQLQTELDALVLSVVVAVACLAVAFLLLVPFSKRALRPFEENLRRQRQFVTDASHELKTPLAIMAANNDLLEATSGPCQWTDSMHVQISRMDKLVSDLVDLARAEEAPDFKNVRRLDLSELAAQASADFQPLAEAMGVGLSIEVEDGLSVDGDESRLEKLLGILLENAIKYCDEGGEVDFRLKGQKGRGQKRHASLTVSNPCAALDGADAARLFDRFYRADPSRARMTGGHGIGLSIAQAIVIQHGGRIEVRKEGDRAVFEATIPLSAGPASS